MIFAAVLETQICAPHGGIFETPPKCEKSGVSNFRQFPQTPIKADISEIGMMPAINLITSGVAAHLPNSTKRGGARNHADRESEALSIKQISNLIAAAQQADSIGLPFTRMMTVHWQAAGVPLAGMAKATYRFTDLLTKTLTRHGNRTAWLWTHENVPGNGHDKGGHCHLLAHVPSDLVPFVTALQRGWLRRITGKPYRARVIQSKPIGGRLGLEAGNPDLHAVNLEAALAYVLKGASAEAASQFNLSRLEPGGRIIGKRCGTSQNIGAKARKGRVR